MICVWQVFGEFQKFTVIAAMFISDLAVATTIFGNGLLRSKVCIKVCHSQSGDQPGLQIVNYPLNHLRVWQG